MRPNHVERIAVVLFNLGGPDRVSSVAPFLGNLFGDFAILRVPSPLRRLLAWWIARARLRAAVQNYALLGGRTPLLELTRAQASSLELTLSDLSVRCFIAMRYWHPLTEAAVRSVAAWQADKVLLVPLYPQYSSTTSGSSLLAWHEYAARAGLVASTRVVCCYPTQLGYIASLTNRAKCLYAEKRRDLAASIPMRILFSAHGLPESIVASGDPYQWQIEQSVRAILATWGDPHLDWVVCYQSRATPQKWLGPSIDAEIARAARDKAAVLIVPISFVSEHSETLVELDVDYRNLAMQLGVPGYYRVATPGSDPTFIASLTMLVRTCLNRPPGLYSGDGPRICPLAYSCCPSAEVPCPTF